MNLAYSDTLCMKMHLFRITKCFTYFICSYIICIFNNFLKAPYARILKSEIKNLINSVKPWPIDKYNGKNEYNLKFMFCARLERQLLCRFELSSLFTLTSISCN